MMSLKLCIYFLILVLVCLVQFSVAVELNRDQLNAKIEEERKSISEHRAQIDNTMNEMRRKSENRIRELNEQAQQTVAQIKELQDESLKSASSGSNAFLGRAGGTATSQDLEKEVSAESVTRQHLDKVRDESIKRRQSGGLHSILSRHSVDEKLVEDISRMAKSSIPHEAMVQHVKQHFPEKRPDEWNDIVVAALGSRNQRVDHMDNEKSRKIQSENRQRSFDRMKASFEKRHSSNDL